MTSHRAASKSDVIEGILRQHGTLPVKRIVQEMQLMGVDAKPNNVRSLMSTLFKRFVSLKPGLWQLWDPALSHAERVILYEESRGREVSPERKAFLQTYDQPKTPPISKLRSGYMKSKSTIEELTQLLEELEKKTEALRITIDACQVVLALLQDRSSGGDGLVVRPPPSLGHATEDMVLTQKAPVTPKILHRKPKAVDARTSCPRCDKMDVAKEDDWNICLSCGWNDAKERMMKS